jgi:hypothetical protein
LIIEGLKHEAFKRALATLPGAEEAALIKYRAIFRRIIETGNSILFLKTQWHGNGMGGESRLNKTEFTKHNHVLITQAAYGVLYWAQVFSWDEYSVRLRELSFQLSEQGFYAFNRLRNAIAHEPERPWEFIFGELLRLPDAEIESLITMAEKQLKVMPKPETPFASAAGAGTREFWEPTASGGAGRG